MLISLNILFISLAAVSVKAESNEPMPGKAFTSVSSQCDAKTDLGGAGKMCNVPAQCLEAPEGHLILQESVHVDTERRFSGTNYHCGWEKSGFATVKGRLQVLNKVCINGYAHSNSGIPYANVRGGVKCTLGARYDVIPSDFQ